MLLKLIPAQNEPTIHFSFAFADLPPHVGSPAAWTNQFNHLLVEELEVPTTVHSFDKAAGITSVLEEVAFDIERGEVRCRFVDGGVEEWGFFRFGGNKGDADNGFEAGQREGRKLLQALDSIIRIVKESTLEDELAMFEMEQERQMFSGLDRAKTFNGKSSNPKSPKHKKQRSMFMQFVSSIGSSIANLTSANSGPTLPSHRFSASVTAASYPSQNSANQPQIPPSPHLAGPSRRARALRRAARSALVDTYRRFVLTELVKRILSFSYMDSSGKYTGIHGGGFCVWILHSMRRRAQERIEQLLQEAEVVMAERAKERGVPLSQLALEEGGHSVLEWVPEGRPSEAQDAKEGLEPTTMVVPLSFSDDEDETETETDGSSVHTPSSTSHFACYPARSATSTSSHSQASISQALAQVPQSKDAELPSPTSPTSPTSPASPASSQFTPTPLRTMLQPRPSTLSQNLTGSALYEYTQLTELRDRLWQLAMFAESQSRISAEETRNRLEILAVRSRRRAWSAGALKAGSGGRVVAVPRTGMGWSMQGHYGLATPFRSSPLARYSWTAEDLKNEQEREAQRSSSITMMPAAAVSVDGFHVYRHSGDGIPEDGAEDHRSLVERELELYEEFPGPSPLDMRGSMHRRRNHQRRKDPVDFGLSNGGVGRLFPVSEELEGEGEEAVDMEFRVALGGSAASAGYGHGHGTMRGRKKERTTKARSSFMGCDEIGVEGEDEDDDTRSVGRSQETLVDDDGLEDPRMLDLELGFGFDFHQQGSQGGFPVDEDDLFDPEDDDDDDDDDDDEFKFDMAIQLERPKIRPRVRTSSIFVRKDGQPSGKSKRSTSGSGPVYEPITFASASSPKYPTLSKSAPSSLPPKPTRSPPLPPPLRVLDIASASNPNTPSIYSEPDVELDDRLCGEYDLAGYGNFSTLPRSSAKLRLDSTGEIDLRSPTKTKRIPAVPNLQKVPIPLGLELDLQDGTEEEFTLAMDLPKSVGASSGRKRLRYSASSSAVSSRPSLDTLFEPQESLVSPS